MDAQREYVCQAGPRRPRMLPRPRLRRRSEMLRHNERPVPRAWDEVDRRQCSQCHRQVLDVGAKRVTIGFSLREPECEPVGIAKCIPVIFAQRVPNNGPEREPVHRAQQQPLCIADEFAKHFADEIAKHLAQRIAVVEPVYIA